MPFLDFREARLAARRRMPRGIFEYIDRGTEQETALSHIRASLDRTKIVPRVLSGGAQRDLRVEIFGRTMPYPFMIAPTAFAGLVRYRGDVLLAAAARDAGIPFCAATASVVSIEDIHQGAGGDLWFQLYMWDQEKEWKRLVDRAAACGVDTLFFTVDTALFPKKVFNTRNGFAVPFEFGIRNTLDVLMHPRWAADVLGRSLRAGSLPRQAHHPRVAETSILGRGVEALKHQPGLSWEHVRQVRDYWKGNLVLKGILATEDARMAADHGADGIVVSGHGGRNFDSTVAPIECLPAIRDAVGKEMIVFADSCVQSGVDVLKLLSAGADAVLLGRAMLYALGAEGQAGVSSMLEIIRSELDMAMAFAGIDGVGKARTLETGNKALLQHAS